MPQKNHQKKINKGNDSYDISEISESDSASNLNVCNTLVINILLVILLLYA